MYLDLKMVSDRGGETATGKYIPAGTAVLYVAHVPGGGVMVEIEGTKEIMSAACFPELR